MPTCELTVVATVCGAEAVARYLKGWRCLEHRPVPPNIDPTRTAQALAALARPTRAGHDYGDETDDPLGRDAPEWGYGKPGSGQRYGIPVRRKAP